MINRLHLALKTWLSSVADWNCKAVTFSFKNYDWNQKVDKYVTFSFKKPWLESSGLQMPLFIIQIMNNIMLCSALKNYVWNQQVI